MTRLPIPIIYSPLLLLILGSYFKPVWLFADSGHIMWERLAVYWAARLVLLISFIYLFFNRFSENSSDVIASNDRPKIERSGDPLTLIRNLAFYNVFMGHWFIIFFFPRIGIHNPPLFLCISLLLTSPWIGLWSFFTLSGYLIMKGFVSGRYSLDRSGVILYYTRRALRICPVYYLALVVVLCFLKPELFTLRTPEDVDRCLSYLMFDPVESGDIIGALWSIITEMQFYLLAPLLAYLLTAILKSSAKVIEFTAVIIFIEVCIKLSVDHSFDWDNSFRFVYTPLLTNLDCFITGGSTAFLVCLFKAKGNNIKNGMLFGILVLLSIQLAMEVWSYDILSYSKTFPQNYFFAFGPFIGSISICAVIFLFEARQRTSLKFERFWQLSGYLATLTYCLYVCHEPVVEELRKRLPRNINLTQSLEMLPLGIIATAIVAHWLYNRVELPFDKIRSETRSKTLPSSQ